MYVCMYVCMYVLCVYMRVCVCTCVCVCVCVCYVCIHTYMYIQAISSAISMGTADVRACRSLHCAPAIVKERALGGIPDCFRGIVWQKLTAADALRHRYPDR